MRNLKQWLPLITDIAVFGGASFVVTFWFGWRWVPFFAGYPVPVPWPVVY